MIYLLDPEHWHVIVFIFRHTIHVTQELQDYNVTVDSIILSGNLKIIGITGHAFSVFFPTGDFRKITLHGSMYVCNCEKKNLKHNYGNENCRGGFLFLVEPHAVILNWEKVLIVSGREIVKCGVTSLPLLGCSPTCICNNNQLVVKRIQCIQFIIQVPVNGTRSAKQGKQGTLTVCVGVFKLRQEAFQVVPIP